MWVCQQSHLTCSASNTPVYVFLLRRAILFTLSIALSYLNYRGLSIVGNAAVISTLYIIVPFVVRPLLKHDLDQSEMVYFIATTVL